jgi:hypothetical protein
MLTSQLATLHSSDRVGVWSVEYCDDLGQRNRSRVNSRGGLNYACAKPATVLVAKTPVSVSSFPQTPFMIDEQCDSGEEDENGF